MSQQPRKKAACTPKRLRKKQFAQAQNKRDKVIMTVAIIVATIMVLLATLAVIFARWTQKPELPPQPTASSPPVADTMFVPTPTPSTTQPKVSGERKSKSIYTILVAGTDTTSNKTDTMMLVTYDVTNQQVIVMSIPRDTLVNVKSNSIYTRLNTVYSLYGMGENGTNALMQEVSKIVGFMPDYHIFINWELVGKMVDALGGVWYDIPYNMDYDDPYQGLSIHFTAGYQHLTGEEAMQIVRWRHNNKWSPYKGEGDGSDLTRLRIQQGFLTAVLEQALQIQNVTKISQLTNLFNENVTSNLTAENMLWFASQAIFGGLSMDNVEFKTMPYHGFLNLYVYPNADKLLPLINDKINPYVEDITIKQLDLIIGNSDGSLSSSTGKLADPRAGYPQISTPAPTTSIPVSPAPNESSFPETNPPSESQPSEGYSY